MTPEEIAVVCDIDFWGGINLVDDNNQMDEEQHKFRPEDLHLAVGLKDGNVSAAGKAALEALGGKALKGLACDAGVDVSRALEKAEIVDALVAANVAAAPAAADAGKVLVSGKHGRLVADFHISLEKDIATMEAAQFTHMNKCIFDPCEGWGEWDMNGPGVVEED